MPLLWLMYYTGIYLFMLGIHISSFWNKKSAQWLEGRKDWKKKLQQIPEKKNARIWFHVSSLGEFEQARPVIEEIKKRNVDIDIILTFFSPSGYAIRKDYALASVHYIPADLPGNAKLFLEQIQPDIAVFTKYDLWPGFINQLLRKKIRTVLISAHWSTDRTFASWNFPLTKTLLKRFDRIFLQDDTFINEIRNEGFHNLAIAGDTRVDRSLSLSGEVSTRLPETLRNTSNYDLVVGSSWPKDEELVLAAAEKLSLKVIIAPHDVSPSNIYRLTKELKLSYQLFSRFEEGVDHQVLIMDSIGLLSVLYAAGDTAYVGGGFGKGIHNILEPASHGKPIIFGPNHTKFPEAIHLKKSQGAWSVNTKEELFEILGSLRDPDAKSIAGNRALDYLNEKAGATAIVSNYLMELLPSEKSI